MTAPVREVGGMQRAPGAARAPAQTLASRKGNCDAAIAEIDENIMALRPQLENALAAWLDAAAPWVGERWAETLETAIAYNPNAVKDLDVERRKALKERTLAMIDNPRAPLEKRLVEDKPEAWPHLRGSSARPDADESFTTKSDRLGNRISQTVPDRVSSMLESVLSDMADLLESEGFNLARFLPGSALSRSQRPRVAEGVNLQWSSEMMRTMDVYGRLTVAYSDAFKRRDELQAQKDRSEAEDLWGKA